MTIDADSSITETYGLNKQGGAKSPTAKVRGYHSLFAMMAGTGDVSTPASEAATPIRARGSQLLARQLRGAKSKPASGVLAPPRAAQA